MEKTLDDAGTRGTYLAEQAVTLAYRVCSPMETGASAAALSRELRAVMGEILRDVESGDGVDDARARVQAKLALMPGGRP